MPRSARVDEHGRRTVQTVQTMPEAALCSFLLASVSKSLDRRLTQFVWRL